MVTNQINFDNWQDRKEVKKGNIGEGLVIDYLHRKGYVVYKSITSGAHPFDNLCASRDKKKIFIAEVKTKEARKYYPDTGINIRSYDQYKFIQDKYSLDVFLFFVDATNHKVYGNAMNELTKPININGTEYPLRHKGIIYFPLALMITLANLTEEQAEQIAQFNTKNYKGAWKI